MTRQQTQQQTQENKLLDLEETESVNKEDINRTNIKAEKLNKKATKKEEPIVYKKKISVQVNSFYDEDPKDRLDRILFAIYECKLFDSICNFLSKRISKHAKDESSNWGVLIISILAAVIIFRKFKIFIPEGFFPALDIIVNSIIVFFTIISIFATARMKRRYQIVGATVVLSIFIPIAMTISSLSSDNIIKEFIESFTTVMTILSVMMAFLTADDYNKFDKSEVFTSEKKYEDDEMDALKDELNEYLTNREKSNNKS